MVCRKFGIPKLYSSHTELLDDPEIEAVVVVTRRHATGPIVLDALQSGRHVLSEKPMAHTRAQAERLVSAQPVGKSYAIGYMKRHDAGVAQAKILLDALQRSGELGRIVLVRAWCFGGDTGVGSQGFVMTDEVRPDGIELWPIAPDWVPDHASRGIRWIPQRLRPHAQSSSIYVQQHPHCLKLESDAIARPHRHLRFRGVSVRIRASGNGER